MLAAPRPSVSSQCRDYQRVAKTLAWISEHVEEQPTRADIASISRVCEQIGGAIYGSHLFRQVQDEQKKSARLLEHILPQMAASDSSMTAAKSNQTESS